MKRPWTLLLGVLAVAVNLRAALSGYPPLLPEVRRDLELSSGTAGLVQTGAALAMAAGSFGGPAVVARLGPARTLAAAVALVGTGSLVRGVPATVPLFCGTGLVGLGMGIAGVALAGVVTGHFAARAGTVTGGYVVAMMLGATAAGAVAVPLGTLLGGWSVSLAAWALPALLAAVLWSPLARSADGARPDSDRAARARPDGRPATPARRDGRRRWSRQARLFALYQAGTSLIFYGWLTWLAPYYQSQGWDPADAGLLVAVFSVAQIPSALLAPALAERRRRWRTSAVAAAATFTSGTVGTLVAPLPPVVGPWPWVVLIGLGAGAMFPLGMTIISWRVPDAAANAATSGLALGTGYTVAGLAPLLMGLAVDLTDDYRTAVAALLSAVALQAWTIARVGPERLPERRAPRPVQPTR